MHNSEDKVHAWWCDHQGYGFLAFVTCILTLFLHIDVDSKLDYVSWLQLHWFTLLSRGTQTILIDKCSITTLCVLDVELERERERERETISSFWHTFKRVLWYYFVKKLKNSFLYHTLPFSNQIRAWFLDRTLHSKMRLFGDILFLSTDLPTFRGSFTIHSRLLNWWLRSCGASTIFGTSAAISLSTHFLNNTHLRLFIYLNDLYPLVKSPWIIVDGTCLCSLVPHYCLCTCHYIN